MNRVIKVSIAIVLMLSITVGIGVAILKNNEKVNHLKLLNNVSIEKQWSLIHSIKVPHSTFYAGFLDEQVGMTVGYHGATYMTKNGGKTWSEAKVEANCRFGLDLLNSKYSWSVGNYGGNRVSTDGGTSYVAVEDLPLKDEIPNNLVDLLSENFIVVGSPLTLACTVDGGYHWNNIDLPKGFEMLMGLSVLDENEWYVVDRLGQLAITKDSGKNWRTLAQLPIKEGIRFDETPSVSMRVSSEKVLSLVYADKNEGIYSYQIDLKALSDQEFNVQQADLWKVVHLEDRARVIPYLSKDGLTLTTVDIVGNIRVFELTKKEYEQASN